MTEPGRTASVVLVRDAAVLGRLPALELALPWWPESHDVVAAVRERHGLDVTVLRLLHAPSHRAAGGHVTYLAETDGVPAVDLAPHDGDPLAEEPLRQPWARPGGPAALLGWADEQLARHGIRRTGPAEQRKSWNLSGIWRLPTTAGPTWLKAAPAFMAHEGAVIDWIGAPTAPRLLGHEPGRVLMAEIPGEANHETTGDPLEDMVALLTSVQERAVGTTDELLARGVPDRRLPLLVSEVEEVVEARAGSMEPAERRGLRGLVASLPGRIAAIESCGVPDTLVHGDFHPGNVQGPRGHHVLLDWGDSFVGHPLFDELAFVRGLGPKDRQRARQWFVEAWGRIAPQADPVRAADLLEPVLPLFAAVTYERFCRSIEPDERVYHDADVPRLLRQALAEAASG